MNQEKNNNQIQRATVEMANRYDELRSIIRESDDTALIDECYKELNELVDEPKRWYNYVFTDPDTGKVGVKDVADRVLVPARYDEVAELGNYCFSPHFPHVMIKDGKYGIVDADGSGNELCPFKFNYIYNIQCSGLFVAKWGEEKDRFGIIACDGTVLVENILTACDDAVYNGVLFVCAGDKWGAVHQYTHQVVSPIYDEFDYNAETDVLFKKGDQWGYVDSEGNFIDKDDYENGIAEPDDIFCAYLD